ncbi:hypothetical protein HKX48_007630 [Thoreauomyces humboldtii]|nr:hypothetical protein HKX48_007630 [Thoreauomyces humboldtii]
MTVSQDGGLHPAFYIAAWMSLSGAVIVFNKYILFESGFPFPIFLTTFHLVFASIATRVLRKTTSLLDGLEDVKLTKEIYIKAILPIGVLFSSTLIFSNTAYLYLSVAFIQMLKATTPVAVLMFGWLLGTEKPDMKVLVKVLVITGGVALASYGEINFVVFGVVCQVAGIVFEAGRLVLVQKLLHAYKMDPLVSLYHFAPICALINGITCLFMEGSRLNVEAFARVGALTLLFNASVAFALNCAVVALIGKTSSLVMCLSGIAKDVILCVVSSAMWNTPIGSLQIVGYGITLAGMVWYKNLSLFGDSTTAVLEETFSRLSAPVGVFFASLGSNNVRANYMRKIALLTASFVILMTTLQFLHDQPAAAHPDLSPMPVEKEGGAKAVAPAKLAPNTQEKFSAAVPKTAAPKAEVASNERKPSASERVPEKATAGHQKSPAKSTAPQVVESASKPKMAPETAAPKAESATDERKPSASERVPEKSTAGQQKSPAKSTAPRVVESASKPKMAPPNAKPASPKPTPKSKPVSSTRSEHCLPDVAGVSKEFQERMIVVSQYKEDAEWLGEVKNVSAVVYEKMGTNKSNKHVVPNPGNEASTFIKFLLDNYDCLPDRTAFVHAHRTSWHTPKPMDKILNTLDWTRAEFYKLPATLRGKTDVARYKPDRKTEEASVPVEIHIFWNRWFKERYGPAPEKLEAMCCAQFVVSRDRVHLNSWDWYKEVYDWLISDEVDSYWSGRALEYTWHVMFGEPSIEPKWDWPGHKVGE